MGLPEGQTHSERFGVIDGTRTRDIPDHNRVLYQLSYDHHALARPPMIATPTRPLSSG